MIKQVLQSEEWLHHNFCLPVSKLRGCSTTALNFQEEGSQWLHHVVEPFILLHFSVNDHGSF